MDQDLQGVDQNYVTALCKTVDRFRKNRVRFFFVYTVVNTVQIFGTMEISVDR